MSTTTARSLIYAVEKWLWPETTCIANGAEEDGAMPRKARRQRQDTFDFLYLWLTGYDVQAELGVNHRLRMNPLWSNLDTRVMEARSELEVRGKCFYPEERKEEKFVLTLMGDPGPGDFSHTVADIQQHDAHGAPRYRTYRGCPVPVFECPKGVAILRRERHVDTWNACMHVPENYISDCLVVLSTKAARYIYIHEHIVEKERWINSFSIQSNDPTE